MKWQAKAPSNIALIKYMGKVLQQGNIPSNPSLSYTLSNLTTDVEIELSSNFEDSWQPLASVATQASLSIEEQQRYLQHLAFIKQRLNFTGSFVVRSANNFPSDCGLASSASSFAALTLCAVKAITALNPSVHLNMEEIAELSRHGSGSSCRSLFSSWVLWQEEKVSAIELPYSDLIHHVVVVSKAKKVISSSAAHKNVSSSLLFQERSIRANLRLVELIKCLREKAWYQAYLIAWQEFWDMHALFETSEVPFGYMLPNTIAALNYLRSYWKVNNDGPLVTMDAGPNIHLLFRTDQSEMLQEIVTELNKNILQS